MEFAALVATVLTAATPLLLAALGELVCERSGVLNLGVEGMMIVGAVAAFATALHTDSMLLGFMAGAAAGTALAAIFALLALALRASQVPSGLALTLFGVGLSAFVGAGLVGKSLDPVASGIPVLEDLPLVGAVLFGHDPLVYFALALAGATSWFLYRTRAGLIVRAIGEDHDAAHALGYRVLLVRLACILYGGACAGLAGAYLSLAYTPLWAENMTAGRGWIALALVVFATWRPWWCALGAGLFGGFTVLELSMQAAGFSLQPQYLAMLPYLATILVLTWTTARRHGLSAAPASLGKPFMAL